MDTTLLLKITQLVMSIIIIGLVMLQHQESGFYSNTTNINRTRRGTEKLIYRMTIVFGILFVAVTVANLYFA